jgi:PAS domain S-box-containing protein
MALSCGRCFTFRLLRKSPRSFADTLMPFAKKGALVLDLNGRIAFASTYFCDLVGVEHDKIAGRSYFDFVFPEEVQEAKKSFEPCKFVIPLPFRFRLRTSKGVPVWTSVQCAPMQTATGEVYAVSATITVGE